MVRDEQITVGRHGGRVGSKKTLSMELSLSHPEAIVLQIRFWAIAMGRGHLLGQRIYYCMEVLIIKNLLTFHM